MMTRTMVALGLLAALLAAGCGSDGSDLTEIETPAVTLVSPPDGVVEVELPERPGEVISRTIQFSSTGGEELVVESARWVGERPSGIVLQGSRSPSSAGECDDGIFFAGSQECVRDGEPSFEAPLPLRASESLLLFVRPFEIGEEPDLGCPAAPSDLSDDLPERVRENYCGAIRVETNGENDAEGAGIVEGDFTIYLVSDAVTNKITVQPTQIRFSGVTPDSTRSIDLTVMNSGAAPVSITSVQPLGNIERLRIDPFVTDAIEIAPRDSKTFTVTLTIGPGVSPEMIAFTTEIEIAYGDGETLSVPVIVDDTRAVLPIPQSDARRLEFAEGGSTESFTLTNPGTEAVTITSVSVRSARVGVSEDPAEFYTVLGPNDDDPRMVVILDEVPSTPDRNKATFTVAYTPPDDAARSPLALLEADYTYEVNGTDGGGTLTIALLGDRSAVPFGVIAPDSVRFGNDVAAGDVQLKRVALANIGTAPLTVEELRFGSEGDEEFEATLIADESATGQGSIAPDEVGIIEIRQQAPDSDADDVLLGVLSDSAVPIDSIKVLSESKKPVSDDLEITATPATPQVGDIVELTLSGEGVGPKASPTWVLTEQPEGSELYFTTKGSRYAFVPRVAGTYRFLATTLIDALTAQPPEFFELTVAP